MPPSYLRGFHRYTNALNVKRCVVSNFKRIYLSHCSDDKVAQVLRQEQRLNPLSTLDSNATSHQARTWALLTEGSIALTKYLRGTDIKR